jgi:hypothetical protein
MEPPTVRVHLQPRHDADQALHALLDVLAGAIADDIFAKARAELCGAPAPERPAPDEAELLGLGRFAGTGGR